MMFLESDPETALRVLTGSRSTVHRGTAAGLGELVAAYVRPGGACGVNAAVKVPR